MATRLNTFRIACWTVALASAGAFAFIVHDRLAAASVPYEPPKCDPLPSNIVKLGPPTVVKDPSALADLNESGWTELRADLRQGDVIRPFETGVTGGHLVMRGACLVGKTLAWIR